MSVTVTAIPMLSDNYAWLLKEDVSGQMAIVDPAEAAPAIAAIDAAGGRLDMIFLTHHHGDHIDGAPELAARYGAKIIGNGADAARLPKLDIAMHEGDRVDFGAAKVRMIETPAHTRAHVSYYIADGGILLPGDTLFSLGCGKFFEGTGEDMFRSLAKFADLPDETLLCCGHEYTESNARFALFADPENKALQARVAEVKALRAAGKATVPVALKSERACNPFLRAKDAETLTRLRAEKDVFK